MPQCRDVQTNGNVHMQSCRDGAGVSVRVVDESSRVWVETGEVERERGTSSPSGPSCSLQDSPHDPSVA
jgi:hypothetical protein